VKLKWGLEEQLSKREKSFGKRMFWSSKSSLTLCRSDALKNLTLRKATTGAVVYEWRIAHRSLRVLRVTQFAPQE
jgi:hypothetical protein